MRILKDVGNLENFEKISEINPFKLHEGTLWLHVNYTKDKIIEGRPFSAMTNYNQHKWPTVSMNTLILKLQQTSFPLVKVQFNKSLLLTEVVLKMNLEKRFSCHFACSGEAILLTNQDQGFMLSWSPTESALLIKKQKCPPSFL